MTKEETEQIQFILKSIIQLNKSLQMILVSQVQIRDRLDKLEQGK